MRTVMILFCSVFYISSLFSQNLPAGKKVLIHTTMGDIKVLLYDETPQHRDNFIKLATAGTYDSVLFHRVIKEFMIQTGDPDSKHPIPGKPLGTGGPGYTLPAEINTKFYHKKGALAAARQGDQVNPQKRSSGSQFYIVQGKVFSAVELELMQQHFRQKLKQDFFQKYIFSVENADLMSRLRKAQTAKDTAALRQIEKEYRVKVEDAWSKVPPFKFTDEQIKIYSTLGGSPHLDGDYTVFGEVLEGLDVVDAIGNSATAAGDRPVTDIRILSVKVLP